MKRLKLGWFRVRDKERWACGGWCKSEPKFKHRFRHHFVLQEVRYCRPCAVKAGMPRSTR